jgi:diguanylate cyclase (GGDEF)-like protein
MLKVESKYTKKYLFAILFFIIMSIICVTIFLTNINSGINEKVQEILLNEVISHRKSLEATISIQYQELEGISEYITSLNTRDMSQLINFTKAFVSKNGFDRIVVAFEDGIGYLSDGSSYDISTRGYYQDTMNGGARNSEPVDSVIDGERRMALSVPIYSQHGQIIGMVMGSYDVRAISEIEFSNLYNNKGYTYLIDYSGNFLINDQKLHNYQGNFYDYCQESNILSNQQLQQIKTDLSNYVSGCVLTKGGKETRYLVYVPLESSEWVICYSVLVSDAFQDYQFIMKYETYLLGAVAMVLTVTVLYIFIVNKKERRVLLKRADYDSLTGLYNRRKLTEEIKRYLKAQSEFGLAILDIDDFKKINDTYGHPIGDIILKEIGQILRDNLGEYLVGRLGGDEFVILIENVQIINIVIQKLELTCNQIAKIKIEEHPDIVVTCSCGLAVAPKDGETVAELYKAADSALYIAKSLGKNKLAKF